MKIIDFLLWKKAKQLQLSYEQLLHEMVNLDYHSTLYLDFSEDTLSAKDWNLFNKYKQEELEMYELEHIHSQPLPFFIEE